MVREYTGSAQSDARDMVSEFEDTIVEMLCDDGEASTDLFNDYPNGDAYHHESHVDKYYDLSDAAAVLDELSDYEESDSGLWEGLQPREAIGAQAAYTYGNAVYSMWRDLIEEINSDFDDISDDIEKYDRIEELELSDDLDDDEQEELDTLKSEVSEYPTKADRVRAVVRAVIANN